MQLQPEMKIVLEKIDFINRYKNLSMKHSLNRDDSFEDYNNNEVLNIFNKLGYKAAFNKNENYFKVVEKLNSWKLQFNVSLKYGFVELIWTLWKDNKVYDGGPWGVLKELLDGVDEIIKYPVFHNYNDLEEVLKEAFSIYEDFKLEIESV